MSHSQSNRLFRTLAGAVLAVALGLALLPGIGAPAASAASPFAPVPCRTAAWQNGDPAFTALPGAKAYFGDYAGGLYRMEIPDKWNGELVLYAHGYAGEGNLLRVQNPQAAWRAHLIEQGFAWAASSYRCNGYVPGIGLQDTMMLSSMFQGISGGKVPVRTYLAGQSMGGHITNLGMQEFPTAFAGALSMCASGPTLFDYFAANGAAAEVVTGLKYSPAEASSATFTKMLAVLGTPPAYTAKGLQQGSIMINSSGGPRPFAFNGLAAYFAATISGAKLAGEKSLLASAASNEDWVYGIDPGMGLTVDQLNRQVRRLPGDPAYRSDATPYNELKPFTGAIARPMVTMHGTGDMFVPIFLERDLRAAVDKAGNGDLLVQRIYRIPAHCQFSGDEINKAFDDLVAWVRGGAKPAGDDINASFQNAGLQFTNPLRPGDPGTLTATPRAPGPPATGAAEGSDSARALPLYAGGLTAIVLAAAAMGVDLARRRRR